MSTIEIRGIDIELHPAGEALSEAIRRDQDFYEANILDFIRDNYPVQRVVIDIGANIGNHSVYFANFLKYYDNIICFEPVPENFNLLTKNMHGYKGVKLFNYALSDKTQTLHMIRNWGNMGASMVAVEGDITVPAYSLDRLYYTNVSLIKVDVEEYEPQVIDGAQDTIARCHPIILIEDWNHKYADLLPEGYEVIEHWAAGETFLYEWKPK